MRKSVGVMLVCVVCFHRLLSDTAHSQGEYLYQSLFFLGTALTAQGARGRAHFYGYLAVCVLFLAGGFFHLCRQFYFLPGAVLVAMVGYWMRERWQRRVSSGRPWAI